MLKSFLLLAFICHPSSYAGISNENDLFELGAPNSDKEKVLKFGRKVESPTLSVDEKDKILKYKTDPSTQLNVGFINSGRDYNIIATNPHFDFGKTGWVASDSSTFSIKKENALFGNASAVFEATKDNQYVESIPYDIPAALKGKPCTLSLYYKSADENYRLMLVSQKGEIIPQTERTLTPVDLPNKVKVDFECPKDKQIKVKIAATAKATPVVFDRVFLGEKEDVKPPATQAFGFYGSLAFPETTHCDWTIKGTNWQVPPENPACPDPIVKGQAQASGKRPMMTFPKMPPGIYLFIVHAQAFSGGKRCLYQWTDGKTLLSFLEPKLSIYEIEYTTTEDRSFYIQMRVGPSNPGLMCDLSGGNYGPLQISVYRFATTH